jgi:lysosomal-associated membrane protein 1/2
VQLLTNPYQIAVTTVVKVDWAEKLFESNGTSANSKKYTCRGEVATDLMHDAKVVFKQIEVQVGSAEHNVDVTSCPADEDVNDMIPIAVGAALLALVAIVLVAYFVGRRRSRRLAYQSV